MAASWLPLATYAEPGILQEPRPAIATLSDAGTSDASVRACLGEANDRKGRRTEDEAYVAADPRKPQRLIAAWQSRSDKGSVVQWSRSEDGGRTWARPRAATINSCAGGPVRGASRASDPWVAFGPDGRAYLAAVSWTPGQEGAPDKVSALVVVASADGGTTWEAPTVVALAPTGVAHDNIAVTADPTRPATVYLTTTRVERGGGKYFGRLGFTRSADGGRTWQPLRAITPAVDGERIGAPQILVDPRSSRIFAIYHSHRRGRPDFIGVRRSEDRGDTWSEEVVATPWIAGERPRDPATDRHFELAQDIVQAVVSQKTGQLLLVYSDARRQPGGRSGISLVWSADGRQWSSPVAVSQAAGETAWLPAIAVDGAGEIAISYLAADFSKSDPEMRASIRQLGDRDAGPTLLAGTTFDRFPLFWPGDYHGLVATDNGFVAVYGRDGVVVSAVVGTDHPED